MRRHPLARPLSRVAAAVLALAFSATVAVAAVIAHDLTGTWDFQVITENGTGTPTVKIKQEGEKITGTYESRMMGVRAISGTQKGDSLKFDLAANGPDGVTLTFAGVIVDKDNVQGFVDFAGQGGAKFTGTRQVPK
jgi:hypothetical protein